MNEVEIIGNVVGPRNQWQKARLYLWHQQAPVVCRQNPSNLLILQDVLIFPPFCPNSEWLKERRRWLPSLSDCDTTRTLRPRDTVRAGTSRCIIRCEKAAFLAAKYLLTKEPNRAAKNVDEPTLLVASNSLRSLLVAGMLKQSWKASGLGGPMTFKTWCIVDTEGDDVLAYCGGGDVLPGIPISACRNAKLAERTLDLDTLCRQPRIHFGANKVTTVQLIQYVSNNLGGSHFDPQGISPRSRRHDLLRRLDAGEFGRLGLEVNKRSLLHHEVLSVAQTVVRSPQVAQLSAWPVPV